MLAMVWTHLVEGLNPLDEPGEHLSNAMFNKLGEHGDKTMLEFANYNC